MSPSAAAPKQRIADGMRQRVAVRVACRTFREGDVHSAQDELAAAMSRCKSFPMPARKAMTLPVGARRRGFSFGCRVSVDGFTACSEAFIFYRFLPFAFLRDVKAGKGQVRGFSNLDVAVGAHNHGDAVAKPFCKAGVIRSVKAVRAARRISLTDNLDIGKPGASAPARSVPAGWTPGSCGAALASPYPRWECRGSPRPPGARRRSRAGSFPAR